jgi:hypothetical protein
MKAKTNSQKQSASIFTQTERTNTVIKLESHTMQSAIARAKAAHPRVKYAGERTYTVISSNGNNYTVRFAVANGNRLGECDCEAGKRSKVCYHLAAAAALNIAVQSMRATKLAAAVERENAILSKANGKVAMKLPGGWEV